MHLTVTLLAAYYLLGLQSVSSQGFVLFLLQFMHEAMLVNEVTLLNVSP